MTHLDPIPGWGVPKGVHGEMTIPQSVSDMEIRNVIKDRLAEEKVFVNALMIKFKRFDGDRVAFEVGKWE